MNRFVESNSRNPWLYPYSIPSNYQEQRDIAFTMHYSQHKRCPYKHKRRPYNQLQTISLISVLPRHSLQRLRACHKNNNNTVLWRCDWKNTRRASHVCGVDTTTTVIYTIYKRHAFVSTTALVILSTDNHPPVNWKPRMFCEQFRRSISSSNQHWAMAVSHVYISLTIGVPKCFSVRRRCTTYVWLGSCST